MQSTNGSAAPPKKRLNPGSLTERDQSIGAIHSPCPCQRDRPGGHDRIIRTQHVGRRASRLHKSAEMSFGCFRWGAPFRSFRALTIERIRILLAHDRSVTKSSVTISGRGHSPSGSPPLRVQYLRITEPKHALKLAACPPAVPGANLKSRTIGTLTTETSKPGRESVYILPTSEDASMRTNAVSIAASLVCWSSIALARQSQTTGCSPSSGAMRGTRTLAAAEPPGLAAPVGNQPSVPGYQNRLGQSRR